MYQLQCPACSNKCKGLTGRSFYKRYREHFRDLKTGKINFFKYLIDNNNLIGPIENSMNVV